MAKKLGGTFFPDTVYIFIHEVMVASKKKTYIRTKINNKQIQKQN